MTTIVKIIHDSLPPLTPENCIKLITYPREQSKDVVTSHLALTHKDTISIKSHHGHWSFSTHQYTYFIVFTQIEKGKVILSVLLHQGDDQKESQSSFNQIAVTLRPLIRSGSIKLNKALLNEALLPTPLPPKELTAHLVNVMEKQKDLYPEWHKVVQALLHSACSSDNREGVTKLLTKGGDLEEEDNTGKTPIHSAASEVSAEGMKWLMSIAQEKLKKRSSIELIARRTSMGKSPADIAVENNNHSALSHMMKVGGLGVLFGLPDASQKKSTDILHTAVKNDSSDSIGVIAKRKQSQLLKQQSDMYFSPVTPPSPISSEMDVSFDVVDDNGNTPLMLAVEKGYLNSCLYLLLGQADPNFPNPQNGNTSLHIAVANGHMTITKMLLIFKAIPTIANKKGQKPVDLASPAQLKQFQSIFEDLISSMETSKSQQSTIILPPPLQPDSISLLSLDGGGVRCVVLIQMLLAIQDRMKELDPMSVNPLYYFDYISATSIGCAAPLYTFYGNTTLETCFVLSLTETVQVIGGSEHSKRTEAIKESLITGLGADTVMADIEYPRIIITSTLADRIPCELHLVTNYGEARNGQKGPKERKVWEAASMTTAAPVYVKPFEGKFIDGGVMVNNPTMDGIVEIFRESDKEGKQAKLGCVLSLGTGKGPVQYVDNVAITMPTFSLSALRDIPSNISAVKNMAGIVMEELTKTDGEQVIRAETFCKVFGSSYYRMTPQLKSNINLAEGDMNKIIDMMYDCFLYLQREREKIDQIARQLLTKSPNLQALFKGTFMAAQN